VPGAEFSGHENVQAFPNLTPPFQGVDSVPGADLLGHEKVQAFPDLTPPPPFRVWILCRALSFLGTEKFRVFQI
jgi:hypothetical protein